MGWHGILFKTCFVFSVLLATASSPTPLLSVYHGLSRESPRGSI